MDCNYLHIAGTRWLCRHPKSRNHAGRGLAPTNAAICGGCKIRDKPGEPLPIVVTQISLPVVRREQSPSSGPGTELKKIFVALGFDGYKGCGCESLAARMDRLGPEGVRERLGEIKCELRKKRKLVGFLAMLKPMLKALELGLPWTIEGLILEACDRAEAP